MVTEAKIDAPLKYVCPVCERDCSGKFCLDCIVDGIPIYAEGPRQTLATIKLAELNKAFREGAKFIVLTPKAEAAEFEVTLCKTRKEVSALQLGGLPCLVIHGRDISGGSYRDFRTTY
jgi:hypothetical protein